MSHLVLVGLGPGIPDLLTREAWLVLSDAELVATPTPQHPALAHLPATVLHTLPAAPTPADIARLLAQQPPGATLVCALAGHPSEHPLTRALAANRSLPPPRIVGGLSLTDCFCTALSLDRSHMQLVGLETLLRTPQAPAGQGDDARAWCETQNIGSYPPPHLPYPLHPTAPALIWHTGSSADGVNSEVAACALRDLLQQCYPPAHPLHIVRIDARGARAQHRLLRINEVDGPDGITAHGGIDGATALYLPPLEPLQRLRESEGLQSVVAHLLGPHGCPWDRQQTFRTLRGNLLEETYEVLEALDQGDMAMLCEELGDLLLQVFVQSEMARQAHHFSLGDVLEQVGSKLVRRHPHVFGELSSATTSEVVHNWEQIKAQELAEKGRTRSSALDGVPAALPALATARTLIRKATRAGFAWEQVQEIWVKLNEELDELALACNDYHVQRNAETLGSLVAELGDVLLVLVSLGQWFGLDAESALRETNSRFRRRFVAMEQRLAQQQRSMHDLSLQEKLALWDEAKLALGKGNT